MSIRISKEIEVHWGDMDALGHVNTTVYLRYLEDARLAWFMEMQVPWEGPDFAPSVVNINCNFRREIRFPAIIHVQLEATLASEKRVVHCYRITDRDHTETLYADAEATIVWIDPATRRSILVPDSVRKLFTEQGLQPC